MNYYQARQHKSGGWHYTRRHDENVWPVGYCGGWPAWLDEGADPAPLLPQQQVEERARLLPFKAKFHEHTHGSSEEACECFKEYQLDTQMRVAKDETTQVKCQVCGEWTQVRVSIGGWALFVLCETHATKEEVAKLYTVGESISSD